MVIVRQRAFKSDNVFYWVAMAALHDSSLGHGPMRRFSSGLRVTLVLLANRCATTRATDIHI